MLNLKSITMYKRIILLVLLIAITAVTSIGETISGGSVEGFVKDNAKNPVTYVNVALLSKGKTILSTTTDNKGHYQFNSVPAGSYFVKAWAKNYAAVRQEAAVVVEGKNCVVKNIIVTFLTPQVMEKMPVPALKDSEKKRANESYFANNTIVVKGEFGRKAIGYDSRESMYQDDVFNTEEYDKINDNEFKEVSKNPLSTFSIDVDKASYSNVRRYINQGSLPPKDAVRVEEMINYFSYSYPQPKGDQPFSINMEMNECPWNKEHKLIHVGLQGKKIETENLPASNLVFLIDVSGSMESENKLPLLKKAFHLLVEQLRPKDRVAIVVYAGNAGLVLPSTPGSQKDNILAALDNLQAGGSTAGGAGIQLAYKIAKENFMKEGNNRVILATDGDFNVGVSDNGSLVRMIEEKREEGTFLTVLGFGMGNYKDSKMEQLADKGNGNYAYIDNILEAKKVFVSELGGTLNTIAKDVKIQVEFNPAQVKGYRLVGYENRLLANEDFNNDKKDAGEMGSGHTVTALYEIIPAGSTESLSNVDPLKYQQNVINDALKGNVKEVMTIKFRYKAPKDSVSKLITEILIPQNNDLKNASENFRFSASVAEFGMILRDSKFKGTSNYKEALLLAKQSKGKDDEGYRAEFIRLIETAELLGKGTETGRNNDEIEK